MRLQHYITSVLVFFLLTHVRAQVLPPITKFTPEVYQGGNQNWSITQSDEKFIYVANNEGLLEFNGESWTLYPSPNNTILRSVHANNGHVYTGNYMDFGYWKRDSIGRLQYTSLGLPIYDQMIEDEQFWKIFSLDQWVLFQSLNRIYIYDTNKEITTYINTSGIVTMYKIGNDFYFQDVEEGMFKIVNGAPEKLDAMDTLSNDRIINIFGKKDDLIILTEKKGFYNVKGGNITKWNIPADEILSGESVYSAIRLSDGSFAIGTIKKGLLNIDAEGNVLLALNQENGLHNNTVLSLFEDQDENLWIALDNGINLINLKSPLSIYYDDKGKLGAVYAAQEFDNKLYLGTNQGLFYKTLDSNDAFKFVAGTNGQVWYLNVYDNTLFCGHNSGTFTIDNGKANLVVTILGTWNLQPIPGTNHLLAGNYAGMSVLEKANGQWRLKNKISGFDYSAKYLEIDEDNNLWINHEYKGIFKLKANEDYTEIIEVTIDTSVQKGKNSGLVKYNNKVLYAYEKGIFEYDKNKRTFIKDSILSAISGEDNSYSSGKMVVDANNNLWIFSKKNISYVSSGQFSKELIINELTIPMRLRNSIIGYENVNLLNNGKYTLGTTSGYMLLDTSIEAPIQKTIYLNSITMRENNSESFIPIDGSEIKLTSKQNNLSFTYSVPDYNKYGLSEYKYILEGYMDEWSNWQEDNTANFENLPYGEYTFKARSRIGKVVSTNTIITELEIDKPWYLTDVLLAVYGLFGMLFFISLNWFYKSFYRRQREILIEKKNKDMELQELEAQKEIIQLRNDRLNQDMEARNRELAISTMNMIKKNKTLNDIKEELNKLNAEGINDVKRIIDRNINNEEDWKFFEEAFNHADKDFFKKVKELHPKLTSNDLRLCVYLRMNLSSKEIARLLNISPRSVEIKRYRLRKKIELKREINLNDYFIDL